MLGGVTGATLRLGGVRFRTGGCTSVNIGVFTSFTFTFTSTNIVPISIFPGELSATAGTLLTVPGAVTFTVIGFTVTGASVTFGAGGTNGAFIDGSST